MHALKVIHASLRPGGLLLDIRPAKANSLVEGTVGTLTTQLGYLDESLHAAGARDADTGLSEAIASGFFALEEHVNFEFVFHFSDAEEWLNYMGAHWQKAHIPDELKLRARELLPRPQGSSDEICIRTEMEASRLRRV